MKKNVKASPVAKGSLQKDIKGKPHKEKWSYCTAVGMLLYFQDNTRPDISMIVHQKAHLCTNPQLTHKQAIKKAWLLFTTHEKRRNRFLSR